MSKNILVDVLNHIPAAPGVNLELTGLCEYLDAHLPELRKIYLFGSQARGDWREDSDVDLIVVVDEETFLKYAPDKKLFDRVDGAILAYMYDHPALHFISPHCYVNDPVTEADIVMENGENPLFLSNVSRDGVKIYDRKICR